MDFQQYAKEQGIVNDPRPGGFPTWGTGTLGAVQSGATNYISGAEKQDPNKVVGTVMGRPVNYAGDFLDGGTQTTNDTSGGNTDPYAAQRAAEAAAAARKEAEDEAKRKSLRGGISTLINNAISVYDSLFGNVGAAAKSQKDVLNKRFETETSSLTDQFNQEMPKIGRAYAGRGAYDSSYRIDSEANATKGFQNQIQDIGTQYEQDAAKIGQYQQEQEAEFKAQKGLLQRTLEDLGNVTDINELTQTRNALDAKLAELQAKRDSTGSQEGYLKTFQTKAPAGDRMPQLTQQLTTLLQGQAPGPLKKAVAQQIIGSAGLPKEEEDQLIAFVNQSV